VEDLRGVNFFSLDDASLKTLIGDVQAPLLREGVRLAAELPVSTAVYCMDWVEEHLFGESSLLFAAPDEDQ
jgi:hypothetical protein